MTKNVDDLLNEYACGNCNRRELIKKATTLGLLSALPASLLTSETRASQPKRGGHLRIGSSQGNTTDSLNPSVLTSGYTRLVFASILSNLIDIDRHGNLVPGVAESWEGSNNASRWVFKLRKDVEFHNGKTLDAEDVIASINAHRGEDSTSAVKSFAEQVDTMESQGENTLVVNLKEGNADFPSLLSAPPFGIRPLINGALDTTGIGSGGYRIENFNPGVSSSLTRYENYYKTDAAYFDSAELLVIADATARQSALMTNEVDIIDRIQPKIVKLMLKNQDVEILDVPSTLHFSFSMRTDLAPYDNNDLRLAMKYAINREEMLKKVLQGYGSLGNDHPISVAYRYFDQDIPQRQYDPDKAKYHFNKSGVGEIELRLSSSETIFNGAMDCVLLYSEDAKKAGIKLSPNRVPNDGYWADVWMKHSFAASYWNGRPTEDWMFTQAYAAESNWNETFWKNDRFNELLKAARTELEEPKRRAMYSEMQHIVRDDSGAVIPMFANHILGLRKNLKHHEEVVGFTDFDGYKILDRWWFS